jgi:mannose/fructose/N-acetylgalactosamine-specific phosphotransferase system component IID
MSGKDVRKVDLLRVGLRLTLLQSAWSEGALQSAGLSYCLIPGLRRIHGEAAALDEAVRRQRAPFNTHPYLAGAIAGAVLRMEADHRPPKRIAAFAREAMGPLAAIADPFMRNALAPAVALIAALTAILAGALAAALTLLVLFNSIHLTLRIAGVVQGYREGEQILVRVGRWIGPRPTRALKWITALAGGVVLGLASLDLGCDYPWLATGIVAAAGLASAVLLAFKRTAWSYVLPVFLAALVLLEVSI